MKEDEEWWIRSNRELEELIDGEDIRFIMFMGRISWLGHVMHMEDNRIPKAILRGTIDGQRKKEDLDEGGYKM